MANEAEFSDSEDEGDNRCDETSYQEPSTRKKPRIAREEDSLKTDASSTLTPSPAPSAASSTGGGECHAATDMLPTAVSDTFIATSAHSGIRANRPEEIEQDPSNSR